MEADRDAVGIVVGLVTKQGTYCDVLVTPETFTFIYRSLFKGTEALNFFRPILFEVIRCNVPSIGNTYTEAKRWAVGPIIALVTMQVTYCDVLVTPETFTFRYRSLFLTKEALKRQILKCTRN